MHCISYACFHDLGIPDRDVDGEANDGDSHAVKHAHADRHWHPDGLCHVIGNCIVDVAHHVADGVNFAHRVADDGHCNHHGGTHEHHDRVSHGDANVHANRDIHTHRDGVDDADGVHDAVSDAVGGAYDDDDGAPLADEHRDCVSHRDTDGHVDAHRDAV